MKPKYPAILLLAGSTSLVVCSETDALKVTPFLSDHFMHKQGEEKPLASTHKEDKKSDKIKKLPIDNSGSPDVQKLKKRAELIKSLSFPFWSPLFLPSPERDTVS